MTSSPHGPYGLGDTRPTISDANLEMQILRQAFSLGSLQKHQGPSFVRNDELHWRDAAVFVSLSSRTNTRQGLRSCRSISLARFFTRDRRSGFAQTSSALVV